MDAQHSPSSSYSPDISMELLVHGERMNVAAMGPSNIVVRSARTAPPGPGTICLKVNGRITVYHIELPQGIDPTRQHQPVRLVRTVEDAAA